MARAFKCDNCQQIYEGVPEKRTPVTMFDDDKIQVVVGIDVTKEGVSGLDYCNNCLRAFLHHVLKGIETWPQAQVGQVGGVDVVDGANLLRGTSGRSRMSLVENEPDNGISLEGLDE